jgi:endonuclease/exonuclease/phosphatase family metal-dependent hydrolase
MFFKIIFFLVVTQRSVIVAEFETKHAATTIHVAVGCNHLGLAESRFLNQKIN